MITPGFVDEIRRAHGLLTIEEIAGLVSRGNVVFDPFSVLVARCADIGTGNVFFPSVFLLCEESATLKIGDNNVFHSNTLIEVAAGPVSIGSRNQFGEGGFSARTNRPDACISIGDEGRYTGGATVVGKTRLGTGSQILGPITVDTCHLEAGHSYRHDDPDLRAGLFKGFGVARNLSVPVGHVIAGSGTFALNDMKKQTFFHPKATQIETG